LQGIEMTSEKWITISSADKNTFSGYLALPPAGTGPGLVLIQEIWGVNDHIRAVAEQYALDGFVVLAPDVFWRQQTRTNLDYTEAGTTEAFTLMNGTDFTQAAEDVVTAVEHLRGLPQVSGKVGVLGFCMGGQLAYRAAASGKPDAAVSYYGGGIHNHLDLAGQISQPILFHYAGLDGLIPASAVDQVRKAFEGQEHAKIHNYEGVDHGFNCWGRPAYNQRAAALARGRTLVFLAQHLAG
jgi:carboxymethylenebutenolidase